MGCLTPPSLEFTELKEDGLVVPLCANISETLSTQ
jgi:hypothetical protein